MKEQMTQTLYATDKNIIKYCDNQRLGQGQDVQHNRAYPNKHYNNLRERLEDFYDLPLDQITVEMEEVDWGSPVGDEIW